MKVFIGACTRLPTRETMLPEAPLPHVLQSFGSLPYARLAHAGYLPAPLPGIAEAWTSSTEA
jgi:hypothetical protein